MNEKYRGITGYKLHRKRFAYTGLGGIRTIKFPLFIEDKNKFKEFCEKIRSDYDCQVGEFNVTALKEKRVPYSLFDLYIDFLRSGAIFHSSSSRLKGLLDSDNEKVKKLMKSKDKGFFELINFDSFNRKVRLNTGLRKKESDDVIRSIFMGNQKYIKKILKKEKNNEEKIKDKTGIFKNEGYIKNRNKIRKYMEIILEGIGTGNGKTKDQDIQKIFWEKTFGVKFLSEDSTKSTIYFIPELELEKELSEKETVERIRKLVNKKYFGEVDFKTLLAMDNNNNGMAYVFNKFLKLLQEGKINEAKKVILSVNKEIWKGKEHKLEKRLRWISSKAKQIENPKLTNSWSDYRTNFGGKLMSWISNTDNQEEKISHVLSGGKIKDKNGKEKFEEGHEQHLDKLRKMIEKENNEKLKELVNKLININKGLNLNLKNKKSSKIISSELEVYEGILSDVRVSLNEFITKKYSDAEEKEIEKERNNYKSLFATLPKLPMFPGKRKKEIMEKLLKSSYLLKSGINGLESLIGELKNPKLKIINYDNSLEAEKNSRILLKRFDTLRNQYEISKSGNMKNMMNMIKNIVKKTTNVDISKMKKEQLFSSYKRRGNFIEVKTYGLKEIHSNLPNFIKELKPDFSKGNIKNIPEYIGLVEIEKIRIGIMTYFFNISIKKKQIEKSFKNEDFPLLHAYLELIKEDEISGSELNKVLQRYVFSELRGFLSMISKEKFIERYVVQPIKSSTTFPLVFSENESEKPRKRWYITTSKNNKSKKGTGFLRLKEKNIAKKSNFENIEEPEDKFMIRTSKYQLQFLNESSPFYGKRFLKENNVEISDYSFIVEDLCKIDFSGKETRIENEKGKTRLYVSIPFKLEAKKRIGNLKKKLQGRKRYLGIDVGEYGLAFSIISPEEKKKEKILHSWFYYNSGIAKIRDRFKEIKERQSIGSFTGSSTSLAGIRETVSRNLTNKIHDICIRYNAVPSYEFSISNFETGSSRMTAIYKTIKTSDTINEGNKAEEAQRKHIWGGTSLIGKHKSSYGTSYVCTKCWKCIYNLSVDLKEEENRFTRIKNTNYVIFNIEKEKVYGFLKRPKGSDKNLSEKEVMKSIKAFTRPPIFDIKSSIEKGGEKRKYNRFNLEILNSHPILSQKIKNNYGHDDDWKEFWKISGNSGIFVCPFEGCNHISDADIQASLIIGLRAWYKDNIEKGKANTEDKIQKNKIFKKELEHYKGMKLPKIELEVPRKSFNDRMEDTKGRTRRKSRKFRR